MGDSIRIVGGYMASLTGSKGVLGSQTSKRRTLRLSYGPCS